MKTLISTNQNIPWILKPGEGRLYITDQLPARGQCATAFGFVFAGKEILMTHLRKRGWDIPGGVIKPDETPEMAVVREIWEETYAKVELMELVGIQEIETFGPKPKRYRWPYPLSVQIYYLCRLIELRPFNINEESFERQLFTPEEARLVRTMRNHGPLYEEGLRRVLLR